MLEYSHPRYVFTCPRSFGFQLVIEETEMKRPSSAYFLQCDTVYGSKVYVMKDNGTKGMVSTLPITNPDTPNIKSNLIDTLTAHYVSVELGAFEATNKHDRQELTMLINNMLSWLTSESIRLDGKLTHIPFANGSWEVEIPIGLTKDKTRYVMEYKQSGKHAVVANRYGRVAVLSSDSITLKYGDDEGETFDIGDLYTDLELDQCVDAGDILAFDSLHFHRKPNNKQELQFNGAGVYIARLLRTKIGTKQFKTILEVDTCEHEHKLGAWGGVKAAYRQVSNDAVPITAVDVVDIINGQN